MRATLLMRRLQSTKKSAGQLKNWFGNRQPPVLVRIVSGVPFVRDATMVGLG
jgi:hypothetical protein